MSFNTGFTKSKVVACWMRQKNWMKGVTVHVNECIWIFEARHSFRYCFNYRFSKDEGREPTSCDSANLFSFYNFFSVSIIECTSIMPVCIQWRCQLLECRVFQRCEQIKKCNSTTIRKFIFRSLINTVQLISLVECSTAALSFLFSRGKLK